MRRKRYLAVAGLLVILLVAGFGVDMMLPDGPGVTKANIDRVENGMTRDEAAALFGNEYYLGFTYGKTDSWMVKSWARDDGSFAEIVFTNGVVSSKTWRDSTETILAKLRRWLHL